MHTKMSEEDKELDSAEVREEISLFYFHHYICNSNRMK